MSGIARQYGCRGQVEAAKMDEFDLIPAVVGRGLSRTKISVAADNSSKTAANSDSALTTRQRQIMELVVNGHPSKNIAADLGISRRTVENHRASIMKKTGSTSIPALVRISIAAGLNKGR